MKKTTKPLTHAQVLAKRKQLGRALAERRKSMGLNQEDVATRSGLAQAKVSNTESATTDTRLGTLIRIAHVLGVELGESTLTDVLKAPPETERQITSKVYSRDNIQKRIMKDPGILKKKSNLVRRMP